MTSFKIATMILSTSVFIALLHSSAVGVEAKTGSARPWGFSTFVSSNKHRRDVAFSVVNEVGRGGGAPDQATTDAALRADAKAAESVEIEELYLPGLLDVRLVHYDQVRLMR
jgi:hypothetical protein